ncbi:MAG: hypothetical protein FWG64_01250 [Firmicutes bacterium]|nr:hypothetical protein [Bacillota bacterium]
MAKPKSKAEELNKPNIILCEGADAYYFIIWYLDWLKKRNENEFENFRAVNFGGNEELNRALKSILKDPNYDDSIKSLLIIRDSETDHKAAIQSIQSALETANFPIPQKPHNVAEGLKPNYSQNIKVAFTLFPTLSEESKIGTLEDLFIENLAENNVENVLNEVDKFVNYLKTNGRNFGHIHKSKLHAYFAITDENSVNGVANNSYIGAKVGEAARDGAFNFDFKTMNSLKSLFLEIMC